jgi:hypothetical protein
MSIYASQAATIFVDLISRGEIEVPADLDLAQYTVDPTAQEVTSPSYDFHLTHVDQLIRSIESVGPWTEKHHFESLIHSVEALVSASDLRRTNLSSSSTELVQELFNPSSWWAGDRFKSLVRDFHSDSELRAITDGALSADTSFALFAHHIASEEVTRSQRLRIWRSFAIDLLSSLKFHAKQHRFEQIVLTSLVRSLAENFTAVRRRHVTKPETESDRSFRDRLLAFELSTGISPPANHDSDRIRRHDMTASTHGELDGNHIFKPYNSEALYERNLEGGSGQRRDARAFRL